MFFVRNEMRNELLLELLLVVDTDPTFARWNRALKAPRGCIGSLYSVFGQTPGKAPAWAAVRAAQAELDAAANEIDPKFRLRTSVGRQTPQQPVLGSLGGDGRNWPPAAPPSSQASQRPPTCRHPLALAM